MATVTKRKWTYKGEEKTAWVVRYVDNQGKRRQETFERQKEAKEYLRKVENELHQKVHVPAGETTTVAAAARLYLDDCERRHKIKDRMTMTSIKNYTQAIASTVEPQLGHYKLTDLTADILQEHLNDLAVTFSRATVMRCRWMLKAILGLAVRKKLIARNLIVEGGVRVPSFERERIPIPSRSELTRLLAAVDVRAWKENQFVFSVRRVALSLAIFCGMRRGEICGLHWQNVDFEAGIIRVRHNMTLHDGIKAPKTWAGIRDIAMPQRVRDILREHHALWGCPEEGLVIRGRDGTKVQPAQLWFYWKTVAKRAGLVDDKGVPLYHFHALRHANVSLLIADGLTPLHIKSHIGHANVSTTLNVYGHLFPEDDSIRRSVDSIAGKV